MKRIVAVVMCILFATSVLHSQSHDDIVQDAVRLENENRKLAQEIEVLKEQRRVHRLLIASILTVMASWLSFEIIDMYTPDWNP